MLALGTIKILILMNNLARFSDSAPRPLPSTHIHLEHPQVQYQVDVGVLAQEQLPASGDRTMQENRATREQGASSGGRIRFSPSLSSISLGASTRRVVHLHDLDDPLGDTEVEYGANTPPPPKLFFASQAYQQADGAQWRRRHGSTC